MAFRSSTNYPRAAGSPDPGDHIPVMFAANLLYAFLASTVLMEVTNTDYEGEIKNKGDEVVIRQPPEIAVSDYYEGEDITYDELAPSSISLKIDKGKKWSFMVGDVNQLQSDIKMMEAWAMQQEHNVRISIEEDFWGNVRTDPDSDNIGATAGAKSAGYDLGATGSPLALTTTNIVDLIVNAGVVLDEQNVPDEDRWIVLPKWAIGLLKRSDIKDASLTGDTQSTLRTGRVGMIDRFTIYGSNLLYSAVDTGNMAWDVLFGHKSAITFATQMTKSETLRLERRFGDAMRGLQVFGYETVRPKALGMAHIRVG